MGGAKNSGSALNHWNEVCNSPRRQIADWHKLREWDNILPFHFGFNRLSYLPTPPSTPPCSTPTPTVVPPEEDPFYKHLTPDPPPTSKSKFSITSTIAKIFPKKNKRTNQPGVSFLVGDDDILLPPISNENKPELPVVPIKAVPHPSQYKFTNGIILHDCQEHQELPSPKRYSMEFNERRPLRENGVDRRIPRSFVDSLTVDEEARRGAFIFRGYSVRI